MSANLYVVCPNIEASMYAQTKLRDRFGFQILKGGNNPHFTDRFVIVSPPKNHKNDKPVICYSQPTLTRDGEELWDRNHNWVPLFDALTLVAMTERENPPVGDALQ